MSALDFRLLANGVDAGAVDNLAVHDPVVGIAELVQREGGLKRGPHALSVQRSVDRQLRHLKPEARAPSDLFRHLERERIQPVSRHNMIDHAEDLAFGGGDRLAGEQHLLRLAVADLPRVDEELVPVYAEGDDRIGKLRVFAGDHDVARPDQH